MAKTTTKTNTRTAAPKLTEAQRKAMNAEIAKYTGTNPSEHGANILLDAAERAYNEGVALKSIRLDGVVHVTKLDREASKSDANFLTVTLSCMGTRRGDIKVAKGTRAALEVLARQAIGKDGQPLTTVAKFAEAMGLPLYTKPESTGSTQTTEEIDITDLV